MQHQRTVWLLLLLWWLAGWSVAWAGGGEAVRAGHLIDVDSGRILKDQVILISDGHITAVGGDLSIPSGAKVIDLSHLTVLPGLIDCHTHLVGPAEEMDPLAELKMTAAEEALRSVPNAKAKLLAGFTTVRDLGPLCSALIGFADPYVNGDRDSRNCGMIKRCQRSGES